MAVARNSVHAPGFCRSLTALLLAHLLAILALAASPAWHHWVHPDADGDSGDEHHCAVTLFTSGGCDTPAPALTARPPLPGPRPVDALPGRPAGWVAPVFAGSRVYEHGPPSRG